MRIIISPAKKMNVDTDSLPCQGLPCFLPRTERLLTALRAMDRWYPDPVLHSRYRNLMEPH